MNSFTKILAVVAVGTVALASALFAGMGQFRNTIPLSWNYDTNDASPDMVFRLYSTTNLSQSVTSWPCIMTIPGTNRGVLLTNWGAQQRWFVITASNWWGESRPSLVADTGPVPSDGHLKIGP